MENSVICFVGTSGGEFSLTNSGCWTFGDVRYIASYTNAPVYLTNTVWRDGATILVDSGGFIYATNGPDLLTAAVLGFAVAVGVLGPIVVTRYLVRKFAGWSGMPLPGGE